MGIQREVGQTGKSLAVTIPAQIAELHNIQAGDNIEFFPIGDELRLQKI